METFENILDLITSESVGDITVKCVENRVMRIHSEILRKHTNYFEGKTEVKIYANIRIFRYVLKYIYFGIVDELFSNMPDNFGLLNLVRSLELYELLPRLIEKVRINIDEYNASQVLGLAGVFNFDELRLHACELIFKKINLNARV